MQLATKLGLEVWAPRTPDCIENFPVTIKYNLACIVIVPADNFTAGSNYSAIMQVFRGMLGVLKLSKQDFFVAKASRTITAAEIDYFFANWQPQQILVMDHKFVEQTAGNCVHVTYDPKYLHSNPHAKKTAYQVLLKLQQQLISI